MTEDAPEEEVVARPLTEEEAYLVSIFGMGEDGEPPQVPPMLNYQKKPVRVWAWQLKEFNGPLIANWINQNGGQAEWFPAHDAWQSDDGKTGVEAEEQRLTIMTLEGLMQANPEDYVIKGVAGEFYPCKPEIFAQTYDVTEEPPANPS